MASKLTNAPVELSLPKFKVESQFELSKKLKTLGMILPFTVSTDFSGMRELLPKEVIYISKVIHKAFVDISEERTEAAALLLHS